MKTTSLNERKQAMNKAQFQRAMNGSDWTLDAYGHYKITANGKQYRLKVQATSVRYEVRVGTSWFNKASDYYKHIEIGTVQSTGRMSIALRGYLIPMWKNEGE